MGTHRVRVIDHHPFPAVLRTLKSPDRKATAGDIAPMLDRAHTLAVQIEHLKDAEQILVTHTARKAGVHALPVSAEGKSGAILVMLGTFQSYLDLAEELKRNHASLEELGRKVKGAIYRFRENRFSLSLPTGGTLTLAERTLVMGVLNVTPDSFSDGGLFIDQNAAVAHGVRLAEEGADLIDVGGESTRPDAEPVPAVEEQERILPVIEKLRSSVEIPISVDTRRGSTAREALKAGASIVNDVSGLSDPLTAAVAAHAGAPVIVMHMRGTPEDMRGKTNYDDVVTEVMEELSQRIRRAVDSGVEETQILIDPGIGFAKTAEQSTELIRRLPELRSLGRPIVIGPSRKSFLAALEETGPDDRLELTLGAIAACVRNGARIVRVHDVKSTVRMISAFEAMTDR